MSTNHIKVQKFASTNLFCLYCGMEIDIINSDFCHHVLFIEQDGEFVWASARFLQTVGISADEVDYTFDLTRAEDDEPISKVQSKFKNFVLFEIDDIYHYPKIGIAPKLNAMQYQMHLKCRWVLQLHITQ